MKRFRILGIIVAGVLTGVATAWPWPSRSHGDPSDADYRAHQIEAVATVRRSRDAARAERPQAKSPEAAAAFIKKIHEEPWQEGTARHPGGIPDFAINSQGQFNDKGLAALDIPLEAKPRLQKILDAALSQASEDMLKRARPDARKSDRDKGVAAYKIRADAEASRAYLEQAERDFATEVTPEQAARLRTNMSNQLNSFGGRDLSLIARSNPATGERSIKYRSMEPATGVVVAMGRLSQQQPSPLENLANQLFSQDR